MTLKIGVYIALACYTVFCLTIGIGKGYDKKVVSSARGFFLGGGTGYFVLLMTTLATWFSTWIFMGAPGSFYKNGVGWIAGMTWQCLILLMMGNWGPKFWRLAEHNQYTTPADLVEGYYGGKGIRWVMSISQLAFIIPNLIAQVSGIGLCLSAITGGEISMLAGCIYAAAIVGIYVFMGGFKSQAWVDMSQALMFMVILWASVFVILGHPDVNGLVGFFDVIEKANENILRFATDHASFWNWKTYLSFFVAQALGGYCAPQVWQRMYAARDSRTIRKMGATLAPFYCFVMMLPACIIGLGGHALGVEAVNADNILITIMMEYAPLLAVLAVVGVCAAGMSTISSLAVSATSIFTVDIVDKLDQGRVLSDRRKRNIGRAVVVVMLIVAVFAAQKTIPGIAIVMNMSTGGFALSFWPIFGMFVWKRATRQGVFWAYSVGTGLMFCLYLFGKTPFGFTQAFCGLLVSGVVLVVVSLVTKPIDAQKREEYFAILKETEARSDGHL